MSAFVPRLPIRGTRHFDEDLSEYLKARGFDDEPRPQTPALDRIFKVSTKSWYVGKLAKVPRVMSLDSLTGVDPWVESCPPGRLFVAGFEPDRAMRLFRLERGGQRGQRATEGAEYLPGKLWHLRTPKVCLVISGYLVVGRETGIARIGDEDHAALFQLLESPINISFTPAEWDRLHSEGTFQDLRVAKAITLVCPGSQVRRDMRDRQRFEKTGSMGQTDASAEDWLDKIEAGAAGLLPPRARKPRPKREPSAVPVRTVGEIFAERAADDFLAGITKD